MKTPLFVCVCAGGFALAAAPLDVSLALNGDVRLGPDGPKLSVTSTARDGTAALAWIRT